MEIKHNLIFFIILFCALFFEYTLNSFGIGGKVIPNFVMCIVFSFAYSSRPVPIWFVAIAVLIGESFFSTTPALMSVAILVLYFFITYIMPITNKPYKNFDIISFMLITIVVYSLKILRIYTIDIEPDVFSILLRMVVTIITFPLFYFSIQKLVKLY